MYSFLLYPDTKAPTLTMLHTKIGLGLHLKRSLLQRNIHNLKCVSIIANSARNQSTQVEKNSKNIDGKPKTTDEKDKPTEKPVEKKATKFVTRPGYFAPPKDPGLDGKFQEDYERIAKYSLIPLVLSPFCTAYMGIPYPPMLDATLGSVALMYSHYGISSMIYQYVPKDKFPRWSKISLWSLYGSTCLAFYGLYELETSNNGVVDLIKKQWDYDDRNIFNTSN